MSKCFKLKPKVNTLSVAILTVSAAMLSACAPSIPHIMPYDVQHPVQIAETVERLELYVRPDGMNLSARDRAAMKRFITQYGIDGDGSMFLNIPNTGVGAPGMRAAQAEIQNMMTQSGMANAPIQTGQYGAAPGVPAPLVLSFRRLAVVPQNCLLNDNLLRTTNNQPWGNFGCSTQANFARMIDDPRQLLEPYARGESLAQRREVAFEKYVDGTDPSSELPARQQVSASEQ